MPVAGALHFDPGADQELHILVHLTARPSAPRGNRSGVRVSRIREPGDFAHRKILQARRYPGALVGLPR